MFPSISDTKVQFTPELVVLRISSPDAQPVFSEIKNNDHKSAVLLVGCKNQFLPAFVVLTIVPFSPAHQPVLELIK